MAAPSHYRLKARLETKLRAWYDLADVRQRALGLQWYPDARAFAQLVSATYNVPLVRVCGVIAALSPAVYWELNKSQAESLIRAHADGEDLDDVVLSTYGAQARKARAILQAPGEIESDWVANILGLQAWKTRAFFRNILDPASVSVTVDRHIVSACGVADRFTGNTAVWLYRVVAEALSQVARDLGLQPCALQATVWITYKETAEAYSHAEGPRPAAPF